MNSGILGKEIQPQLEEYFFDDEQKLANFNSVLYLINEKLSSFKKLFNKEI